MTRPSLRGLSLALLASLAAAQHCPPRTARTIDWQACGTEDRPSLQCAYLEVPLDWTNPSGETLNLPLVRIPAESPIPRNKTIITNPGGPGASGVLFMATGPSYYPA